MSGRERRVRAVQMRVSWKGRVLSQGRRGAARAECRAECRAERRAERRALRRVELRAERRALRRAERRAGVRPARRASSRLPAERQAERRVEPLVQICIEWGKTGVPPEDTIRSYQEPSSSAQKNGKQEEKAKKSPTPPRIPLLKKTIQRKQIAKGVNILQQRLKVK